jgi:hypothetical protein
MTWSDIRCVIALTSDKDAGRACAGSRRYPAEYRALMTDRNRRFLLHERPAGRIGSNTFELSEQPIPDIGGGED